MKKVYIFFIATEFKTGKAIRFLTRNTYNHVAFSFTKDGSELYSFARYRYHEPLLGGFGIEYTDRYADTLGDTKIKVCEYSVSDEHYERIKNKIGHFMAHKDEAKYNFLDIVGYPFHVHLKLKYSHTCISFLLDLLERKDVHTIGALERKLRSKSIYEGTLANYVDTLSEGDIDFYEKRRKRTVCMETLRNAAYIASVFMCSIVDGSMFQ